MFSFIIVGGLITTVSFVGYKVYKYYYPAKGVGFAENHYEKIVKKAIDNSTYYKEIVTGEVKVVGTETQYVLDLNYQNSAGVKQSGLKIRTSTELEVQKTGDIQVEVRLPKELNYPFETYLKKEQNVEYQCILVREEKLDTFLEKYFHVYTEKGVTKVALKVNGDVEKVVNKVTEKISSCYEYELFENVNVGFDFNIILSYSYYIFLFCVILWWLFPYLRYKYYLFRYWLLYKK